jgi:hypothetical protein
LRESGSGRIQLPLDVAEGIYNGFIGGEKGTASMLLLDYPVKADEVFLYNNNVDGVEPQLLYKKVGTTVEQSIDFPGFYNMNILSTEPYITKATKGGKRVSKKRRKSVKKTKKRRNFNKSKRRLR